MEGEEILYMPACTDDEEEEKGKVHTLLLHGFIFAFFDLILLECFKFFVWEHVWMDDNDGEAKKLLQF